MDYAELKEWEQYFYYEPTAADRMETQLAVLMHMLSGFLLDKPKGIKEFMVSPLKKPQPKDTSSQSSMKKLWEQAKAIFGDKNEQ